jgi:hypothetical protein
MSAETEEWRPVGGYEGLYEVSDHGRVRSVDRLRTQAIARGLDRSRTVTRLMRGKILKPTKIKAGGYLRVCLSDGARKPRGRKVHQLVTAAFIGACPAGMIPLHGDGNPENNRRDNLRYGTHAENVADAKAHGTFIIGGERRQAKLDETSASAIKALIGHRSRAAIAKAFGVSTAAIDRIREGENWKHVTACDLTAARRELDRRQMDQRGAR